MLITLGLILLILIMVVGGDRGVVSLIALCGNLLILSLAIWLMASGVPVLLVTVCVGVVISNQFQIEETNIPDSPLAKQKETEMQI